ncbi:hypothetical protein DPEC_G00220870 [Dallia pectoralis]|uniref:Uncharacterized protein n=1 Tax=Dallia pectoralis TaxID=75939 RepID=A0ACC2G400_DALPE|nr:hypothetical protein DPEC_G00220870 [Dallia pectoralis]
MILGKRSDTAVLFNNNTRLEHGLLRLLETYLILSLLWDRPPLLPVVRLPDRPGQVHRLRWLSQGSAPPHPSFEQLAVAEQTGHFSRDTRE